MSNDITYIWNLEDGTSKLIYKTESHRCKKQTYGYQGRKAAGMGEGGGGINWEIGVDTYTLLYI